MTCKDTDCKSTPKAKKIELIINYLAEKYQKNQKKLLLQATKWGAK